MICPYCGAEVKLEDSAVIYGRSFGYAWVCSNFPACDSYVGCHPGTKKPLGTLANAELRRWRNQAHSAFDPLWKSHKMRRSSAYRQLSEKMQIPSEQCHIGMFSIEQCKKVIQIYGGNKLMSNTNSAHIVLRNVRLSYTHLDKPYASQPGQEPKYSATILVPKNPANNKALIDAAVVSATQKAVEKYGKAFPATPKVSVHDGDGLRPSDSQPFGDECKGCWVFTASNKSPVTVVDLNLQPILDATQIYSGMYANVGVTFFGYNAPQNKGIGVALDNVQKTADGEPLGGTRASAEDDFGGEPAVTAPYIPPYPSQAPAAAPQYPQYAPQTPAAIPPWEAPAQPYPYGNQPYAGAPVAQPYPDMPQGYPQYPAVDPITGAPLTR